MRKGTTRRRSKPTRPESKRGHSGYAFIQAVVAATLEAKVGQKALAAAIGVKAAPRTPDLIDRVEALTTAQDQPHRPLPHQWGVGDRSPARAHENRSNRR